MMGEMQAQIAMGTLTIADVRRMKQEGVEIENVISPDKRMALFRKNAEARLTDGSGAADIESLRYVLGLSPIPPTVCPYSYQKGLVPLP